MWFIFITLFFCYVLAAIRIFSLIIPDHVSHQHDHVTPSSFGRDTTIYGQRISLKNIAIVKI